MKQKILYPIWAVLYVICVCLGAIPERSSGLQAVMTVVSIASFVPGGWILTEAIIKWDKKTMFHIRLISGLSLGLTLLAMVGNLMSALGSETLGIIMHVILVFVSAPMMSWGSILSPLFWAVLFFASIPKIWKK